MGDGPSDPIVQIVITREGDDAYRVATFTIKETRVSGLHTIAELQDNILPYLAWLEPIRQNDTTILPIPE